MCGIAGIVDSDGRRGARWLRDRVSAMNASMIHRGPDDSGVWIDPTGRCGLAHRRLSIVDLSPLARQPMVDPTGDVGMTYNGEVYNFRDLRRRLESQGRRFVSQCDAEVVLHVLAEQQVDRIESLRGMMTGITGSFAHGATIRAEHTSSSAAATTSLRRCTRAWGLQTSAISSAASAARRTCSIP